ncbi:helix-turn-helix domain-containing protein [Actinomyces faecalis]|uniref:helix-turn-helix domain-containing protein n=1 Tax=Actinomyces faecalis TaxID=2722820 RepID=UPI001556D701|nr:helix-turn-helix domain-containing protein [Actinomyces faecalis]
MSFQAVHWALHEVQGVPNKLVLVVLAEYADEHGCCWPSQQAISRSAELSESTVRRTLRAYEQMGLISSTHRYVVDEDGSKRRASNVYQLHIGTQPQTLAETLTEPATKAEEPVDNSAEGLPVNLTGRGGPVENSPVGNSAGHRVSGLNTYTGQSDRKVGATGQIRGATGHQVTGITTIQTTIENHQTRPDQTPKSHQDASESAQVGSGQVGPDDGGGDGGQAASSVSSASVASPASAGPAGRQAPAGRDAGLIAACLPAWMHPMDAPGAAQVAGLLRERVEAGWTPSQIASLMDAPPPPGGARRLSALVGYRLEANVAPELAPAALARPSASAQDDLERQRAARSEALAATSRETDPAWDQALETARQTMPEASWVELAVEARRLLAAHRPAPATGRAPAPQPSAGAAREGPPGRAA